MFKDFFSLEGADKEFTIQVESNGDSIDSKIELIRKKFKIKNMLPTKFGYELIFFKKEDAADAGKLVDAMIDGNSIFISTK